MKTFTRYFLHFLIIITLLAILVFSLGEPHLSLIQMVLCYTSAVVIYVFPMALLFDAEARSATKVMEGAPKALLAHLDVELRAKGNRIQVSRDGNRLTYAYAPKETSLCANISLITRYMRWLTNPVVVTLNDSNVTIEGPLALLSQIT